jgi:hypothetical protein
MRVVNRKNVLTMSIQKPQAPRLSMVYSFDGCHKNSPLNVSEAMAYSGTMVCYFPPNHPSISWARPAITAALAS